MRFAEHIDEPDLRWLYLYWLKRKAGRFPPPRDRIDAVDLRHLLPNIFIIEVDHAQERFRYRLAGSEVEALVLTKLHGRWLDEAVISPMREFFDEGFCISAFQRKVHFRKNTMHLTGRPYIRYARILLPLSNDGERIDHLLGCIKIDQRFARGNPSAVSESEITIADIASFELDAYSEAEPTEK